MATGKEKLLQILSEAGVRNVFIFPGQGASILLDDFYDYRDRINLILARHEQQASIMAQAYGRLTGTPGVFIAQGLFAASSGGFGIMEAYMTGSPMVVITDVSDRYGFGQHGFYQSGSGEYGSVDVRNVFRSITKFTSYATTDKEFAQGVQMAIKHATTGRCGPAVVLVKNQVLLDEILEEKIPRLYPIQGYVHASPTIPPKEDITRAVEMISQAKSPVMICGNGVRASNAYPEVKALSDRLGIPFATSYLGKGGCPETEPLALGMMGSYGQKVANTAISEADLLLIIGCSLSPECTKMEEPSLIDPLTQKLIQVDIDPLNAGWTYPVDMVLVGDARRVLKDLLTEINAKSGSERAPDLDVRHRWIQEIKEREGWFGQEPELYSDEVPILPQRFVHEIQSFAEKDDLIILDAGGNRIWMSHLFQVLSPGSMWHPGGTGCMGWGAPASIAAKIAYPNRRVICVAGDGGFAMTLSSLSTAVQYNLPIIFTIMNNSCLGMSRDNQQSRIGRDFSVHFAETDFAKIAEGFGCKGIRVHTPSEMSAALRDANLSRKPSIIDVVISQEEPYFKCVV